MIVRRILNLPEISLALADAVLRERGISYSGEATIELLTLPDQSGALGQVRVEVELKDEAGIQQ